MVRGVSACRLVFPMMGSRFKKSSRRWKFPSALLVLLATVAATAAWTPRERAHLDAALRALNATVADLEFTKDVGEPRSALRWVRAALHDPLTLDPIAAQLAACPDTEWWSLVGRLLEADAEPALEEDPEAPVPKLAGLAPALAAALEDFVRAARRADRLLAQADRMLSSDEREALAAATLAGAFNVEDEEAVRAAMREAGIRQEQIDTVLADARALDATPAADRFFDAAARWKASALLAAGRLFHRAVIDLYAAVAPVSDWPEKTTRIETELGPILLVIGADCAVDEPALLILNPDGRTTYRGSAGSANGLRGQRLAAVVDLAGADSYAGNALLGPGAALFGIAIVLDAQGDDRWRAEYVGCGAGLWGVGWVEDLDGADRYEGRALGQGAAVAGFGALIDCAGDDRYRIGWQGQGFAGWSGFGLLADHAGDDRYFAGGQEPDHERNPDHFLSLAQGFSIGNRPFAGGGVGVLRDDAGDDGYEADVYGQGVSYYYSAGFLIDGGGNDRYRVHQYGQGCGIHLSLGLLAEAGGDDAYVGGILAQGAAHDFAVGGLTDRGGNDSYIADKNAQGHGMNNAFGWLLDVAGDDTYRGTDRETTQGVGNHGGTRESGSIGLLLDLGGEDRYSAGVQDDETRVRPYYGVVYDAESARGLEGVR